MKKTGKRSRWVTCSDRMYMTKNGTFIHVIKKRARKH